MEQEKYYEWYEHRYRAAFQAGADRWGHGPQDEALIEALKSWVEKYHLKGKKIIEFACGEGASGVILSELGCIYHGVDIAPSALEKAKLLLSAYPAATVGRIDMVRERPHGAYDAALDVMGFHMLVTDKDRQGYLRNAASCLAPGSPMLFFRECYAKEGYDGEIESIAQWSRISGMDFTTPQERTVMARGNPLTVMLPILPARPRNEAQYRRELNDAGFLVRSFMVNGENAQVITSATLECVKSAGAAISAPEHLA